MVTRAGFEPFSGALIAADHPWSRILIGGKDLFVQFDRISRDFGRDLNADRLS